MLRLLHYLKGLTMFSTYLRLNLPVWASARDVIRATYGRLKPSARARVQRDMLAYHASAQALHARVMP